MELIFTRVTQIVGKAPPILKPNATKLLYQKPITVMLMERFT